VGIFFFISEIGCSKYVALIQLFATSVVLRQSPTFFLHLCACLFTDAASVSRMINEAEGVLRRAMSFYRTGKLNESFELYQSALASFMDAYKNEMDPNKKAQLLSVIEAGMAEAESVKKELRDREGSSQLRPGSATASGAAAASAASATEAEQKGGKPNSAFGLMKMFGLGSPSSSSTSASSSSSTAPAAAVSSSGKKAAATARNPDFYNYTAEARQKRALNTDEHSSSSSGRSGVARQAGRGGRASGSNLRATGAAGAAAGGRGRAGTLTTFLEM
jgi:hypothetical protein